MLDNSKEEQLATRIQNLENTLKEIKDIRDVPGKREELFEQVRSKNPVQWDEASGAWVKASTMPPPDDVRAGVDLDLVRSGKVFEILSTTLAKMARGSYDVATGKYKHSRIGARAPWGVGLDLLAIRDAFDTQQEIGDCVVLRVDPRVCEGGKIVC